nr:microtubule-associated protein 70-2-like [Ipomoea batatas]
MGERKLGSRSLTVQASFKEGKTARRGASVRPSLDADEFINLLHGSDPMKMDLNRIENEDMLTKPSLNFIESGRGEKGAKNTKGCSTAPSESYLPSYGSSIPSIDACVYTRKDDTNDLQMAQAILEWKRTD